MIRFAAICAVSLFAPFCLACSRQDNPKGALLSYEYRYNGSMSRSGLYYKVERTEEGIRITFSDQGSWGVKRVYSGPDDALDTIARKAAGGKLKRMKERYKTPFHVLDGWDWSVHLRYESGSISSGGYMSRPPKAQTEAIEGINAYIGTLLTEENILGTASPED